MEEARAQRLDRGLLRFVTIRAFRSCCAGEVWYLEAGTDAPRKHQQISSSLRNTLNEILKWNKRWGIWNFLAAGPVQGGLLLQSEYLIFIWRLAQSGEITFFVRFLYTSHNISSSFFQTTKHIKTRDVPEFCWVQLPWLGVGCRLFARRTFASSTPWYLVLNSLVVLLLSSRLGDPRLQCFLRA